MADSYHLETWQTTDGLITDAATLAQPAAQELFAANHLTVTTMTNTADWPATTKAVGFTLNDQPDNPVAIAALNHGQPLITAIDTLKTLLANATTMVTE